MSVCLLVKSKTDPEPGGGLYVPVATEANFTTKWLRGCQELGLEWVPMFELGLPIDGSNENEVGRELGLLRDWMASRSDYEHETRRILRLIQELAAVIGRDDLEVWVG